MTATIHELPVVTRPATPPYPDTMTDLGEALTSLGYDTGTVLGRLYPESPVLAATVVASMKAAGVAAIWEASLPS